MAAAAGGRSLGDQRAGRRGAGEPPSESTGVRASAKRARPAVLGPDLPARVDVSSSPEARGAGPISRRRLRSTLRRLARAAGPGTGLWVADLDARSRRTIYARKARRRRILASNEKLFTTAAALDRLGAGRRIATAAYRKGSIDGRTLRGDLFLVGGGDPSLGSSRFAARAGLPRTSLREIAKQVRAAGVLRITGRVRADDSVFDRVRGVPDSNWEFSEFLGGKLSGLSYNAGQTGSDPALAAAAALRRALRKRGVGVRGGIARGTAPGSVYRRGPIGAIVSPRLGTLIAATNKHSNNFYAEMLLKRIWAKPGRPGTTSGGAKAVRRFARREGTDVHAVDGSGLTRSNRASPREVGRLLAAMQAHRARRAFDASLPIAGRDGTLVDRMKGTRAAGRCRAKTGTLSGVSALSGYCDSPAGTLAFSILMNGTDIARGRALQDRMVISIARYRG
jgi:D-alanyl-D-alanine carboxypeptidase/D-alanyl-D-alanine-endopeptidase (penicillin-binding protein 4)